MISTLRQHGNKPRITQMTQNQNQDIIDERGCRHAGKVSVKTRDGISRKAGHGIAVDNNVIERLRSSFENKTVALVNRQSVRQVNKVRTDYIGTRINHDLIVGGRCSLDRGDRIGEVLALTRPA